MDEQVRQNDIASALHAEIAAEGELIPSKFDQSAFQIPKYLGNLGRILNRHRVNDFRKGSAAEIDDGNGNATFAELLVSDRLRTLGWDCVWYSAFGDKIIKSWPADAAEPQCTHFPEATLKVLREISTTRQALIGAKKATFSGIPDVIAWRENDLLMIECKHAKKDHVRRTQAEWFHCALRAGVMVNQLGIYEWKFKSS